MQRNYLIIVVVAVVILAIVGAFLYLNFQTHIHEAMNVEDKSIGVNVTNDTINLNVSNKTVSFNVSNDTVSLNASNDAANLTSDDGWIWYAQQNDYVRQYIDLNGNPHTIFKSTGDDIMFTSDGSVFLNGVNITNQL